jgi:hypothetical protein
MSVNYPKAATGPSNIRNKTFPGFGIAVGIDRWNGGFPEQEKRGGILGLPRSIASPSRVKITM